MAGCGGTEKIVERAVELADELQEVQVQTDVSACIPVLAGNKMTVDIEGLDIVLPTDLGDLSSKVICGDVVLDADVFLDGTRLAVNAAGIVPSLASCRLNVKNVSLLFNTCCGVSYDFNEGATISAAKDVHPDHWLTGDGCLKRNLAMVGPEKYTVYQELSSLKMEVVPDTAETAFAMYPAVSIPTDLGDSAAVAVMPLDMYYEFQTPAEVDQYNGHGLVGYGIGIVDGYDKLLVTDVIAEEFVLPNLVSFFFLVNNDWDAGSGQWVMHYVLNIVDSALQSDEFFIDDPQVVDEGVMPALKIAREGNEFLMAYSLDDGASWRFLESLEVDFGDIEEYDVVVLALNNHLVDVGYVLIDSISMTGDASYHVE